jgi:Tfp pilus assembly protein PilX
MRNKSLARHRRNHSWHHAPRDESIPHAEREVNYERRGAVLVAVLVVMMVCSLLFGAMLRTNRDEHRLLRIYQQRLQAQELAQAGLERAAARFARDAAYDGEVWQLSAAELAGSEAAAVTIEIEPVTDRPRRRRATVLVDYPQALQRRIRHRHEALIDLPERTQMP